MGVSKGTYEEIADILRTAGYDHAFMENGELDMQGIAIVQDMKIPCLRNWENQAIQPPPPRPAGTLSVTFVYNPDSLQTSEYPED